MTELCVTPEHPDFDRLQLLVTEYAFLVNAELSLLYGEGFLPDTTRIDLPLPELRAAKEEAGDRLDEAFADAKLITFRDFLDILFSEPEQ